MGETAYACCSLLQDKKNKNKIKTGQHLTHRFEISITVSPAPALSYFCSLGHPRPFLPYIWMQKIQRRKEKALKCPACEYKYMCALTKSKYKHIHTHAHLHSQTQTDAHMHEHRHTYWTPHTRTNVSTPSEAVGVQRRDYVFQES